MINKKKILYLSFDGLTDPLGRSQVVPLILELSKDYNVNIISFEKKIFYQSSYNEISNKFFKNNINHYKIKFYKNYFVKTLSFFNYFLVILKLIFFNKVELIHIRGYQPIIFLYPILLFKKLKIIFDIRGFWPEEKIDRNNWSKNNWIYKVFKILEKYFFKYSKIIICLTKHSKEIIIENHNIDKNKIHIIPTCSSKIKFNINEELISTNKIINEEFIKIGYLGTTIGAYNFNKTLELIKTLIDNNIKFKFYVYTFDDKKNLVTKFKKNKINENFYFIKNINYDNIEKYLSQLDFVIFYLNNNYSIKASFPTKISECLLSGVPIICNNFNKDIEYIIKNNDFIFGFENENLNLIELKEFIFKIINNKKKYKILINNFANKKYENTIAFKNYINIYQNLINV